MSRTDALASHLSVPEGSVQVSRDTTLLTVFDSRFQVLTEQEAMRCGLDLTDAEDAGYGYLVFRLN